MTILLAIEAATNALSIGLRVAGQDYLYHQIVPRQHTDFILPKIDELLIEAGVRIQQVSAIAVGNGPGSFMGVRLAIGVAQGLAFALDKPLIPISTLQVLAQTAVLTSKLDDPVLAAWDARMGEIYWGAYRLADNGLMQALTNDAVVKPANIRAPGPGHWNLVGNAWQIYRAELNVDFLNRNHLVADEIYPRATALLQLASDALEHGETSTATAVAASYVRHKVAERPKPKH